MSEFSDVRRDFFRLAVQRGWATPDQVEGTWPLSPERWLKRLYKVAHFDLGRQRRLVNHFAIGADPEFVFVLENAVVHGQPLGLKAGLAFGADNNGRLIELRPTPSRFCLEVLGSMWTTLKWLSLLCPKSVAFNWRAGAFIEQDGLGGHVHFGRLKRALRERELSALDTLSFYLFRAGVWDEVEGRARIHGAKGGGAAGYGKLGDQRVQKYGFEYRTQPSWLCSPWMAYLALVLSKLAVFDPSLFPPLEPVMEGLSQLDCKQRLTAVLAFYKGLDDDAELAYEILTTHGWPVWHTNDFKPNWGIPGGQLQPPRVAVDFCPSMLAATEGEIAALTIALLRNKPPEIVTLEPNWSPAKLPEGYVQSITGIETRHAPGLGEIQVDLVYNRAFPLSLEGGGNGNALYVPLHWSSMLGPRWTREIQRAASHRFNDTNGKNACLIGADLLKGEAREAFRRWLLSGILPLWVASDVRADSFETWHVKWFTKEVSRVPKLRSRDLLAKQEE